MVREWLYAGPFGKDVSGFFQSNYHYPVEPYVPMLEESERALDGLIPAEGKALQMWGEEVRWRYQRTAPSESKIVWVGTRGPVALLALTYAFTRLNVPSTGPYRLRLQLFGTGVIAINGKRVFSERRFFAWSEHSFEVELQQGSNECLLMLANVGVHYANNAFRLVTDKPVTASVPLLLAKDERAQLEEDFRAFHIENPVVTTGEAITLRCSRALKSTGEFVCSVSKVSATAPGAVIAERSITPVAGETLYEVIPVDHLPSAGTYLVRIDYRSPKSEFVSGVVLEAYFVRFLPQLDGESTNQGRCRHLLEQAAQIPSEEVPSRPARIFRELARLETGRAADPEIIRDTLAFINQRCDCADFAFHGLLRIYQRHRDSLPAELVEEIRKCMLNFKYAIDEPGPSMMYMKSENHRMLFYSAEYLAGQLFPVETFTNSNQNGLFHALKGRLSAEEWLREKGTYGFEEWHSNTYYEEDLLALLSLYDYADKRSLAYIHAARLIDFLCAILASHTYKGVMATTHGRSYPLNVMYPEMEAMSRINWLLMGVSGKLVSNLSIGAVALATSSYQPSPVWKEIAANEEDLLTRTRMGFFPELQTGGVNCSTYRTRHYMVSGLVESMKARPGNQAQAGQLLLDGKVPVFVTCFETRSGGATPSYWGGQYRMPKTITYRNLLACIYNLEHETGCTHCYFPERWFSEVREMNGWLLARANNAYAGIFSLKPYERVSEGEYAGRELLCPSKRNIWLMQAGGVDEWGSFDAFVRGVAGAPIERLGEDLVFVSPSLGRLELGWDRQCKANDRPVLERDFPLIENEHAFAEYGSGVIRLNIEGASRILSFRA